MQWDVSGGTGTFRPTELAGQAVNLVGCSSVQGRLREYSTWNGSGAAALNHGAFGVANELDAGVRAHCRDAGPSQINGGTSPFGACRHAGGGQRPRDQGVHAVFAQNRFLRAQWALTPGLCNEHIDHERTNPVDGATGTDTLTEVIPERSARDAFNPAKDLTFFTGVHKRASRRRAPGGHHCRHRHQRGRRSRGNREFSNSVCGPRRAGRERQATLLPQRLCPSDAGRRHRRRQHAAA